MLVSDMTAQQLLGIVILANGATFFAAWAAFRLWNQVEMKRQRIIIVIALAGLVGAPLYLGLQALNP